MEETLIDEVSSHPILYNQSLGAYKDNELKNNIWLQITEKLMNNKEDATVEKIKQRWKSLRDTYIKALRKKRTKSGQSAKKIKPWRFEKEMEFLQPFVSSKNIISYTAFKTNDSHLEEECSHVNAQESCHCESQETRMQTAQPTTLRQLRSSRNKIQSTSSVGDVSEFIKKSCEESQLLTKEQDPVDAFFSGIAQTVKCLSPVNIALVKKDVANLVMDAELRELQEVEFREKL